MRIPCPACQASYDIPDHLLVNKPVRMRCARCGAEWAWIEAKASPDEHFELPDLFSAGPLPHVSPVPPSTQANRPELPSRPEFAIMPEPPPARVAPIIPKPLAMPEPARKPIGSPVFRPGPEPSLPPLPIPPAPLPAPPRSNNVPVPAGGMMEIPRVPANKSSVNKLPQDKALAETSQDDPTERDLSREAMFRRIIETNRRRSLMPPPRSSRRPQVIAVVALIVLIALFLGVHFVMVNGVTAGPAG